MEQNRVYRKPSVLLCLLGLLFLVLGLLAVLLQTWEHKRFGVLDESILVEIPLEQLPEDTLYITYDRQFYARGEMTLIIPAIDVFTPIGESTDPDFLKQMPGLYEFATLPGDKNGNTSIAGHRDIYDMAFYSLDRMQAGDYLYLLYQDTVYCYEYLDTAIIQPDDWSVILPQGFNCLTLTTCDPIGTTWKRLVVRGTLQDVKPFDETYQFLPSSLTIP